MGFNMAKQGFSRINSVCIRKTRILYIAFLLLVGLGTIQNISAAYDTDIAWTHLSSKTGDIPPPGPSIQQTASLILDIDMDGINDFIIGSRNGGPSLYWYKKNSAGWTKYLIEGDTLSLEAGGAFNDIDGDGDLDVVFGGDWKSNKVWWWENPYPQYDPDKSWVRREIKNSGANQHHDEIFGDFDGDGKNELVFWNQKANKLFLADIPANPKITQPWPYTEIWSSDRSAEGIGKSDIDKDGKVDLVAGGRWFKHTGGTDYTAYLIDDSQRNSRIDAGDLVVGNYPEIVMVPGDASGRLKWYECKGDPTDSGCWVGHDLLGFDVDHGHSLDVVDINNDGNLDIFAAEMNLNDNNPDAKSWVFFGNGNGNFETQLISEGIGNHESKVADLDGDKDVDILGKPYNWDTPRIDIWLNNPANHSLDPWGRQLIDAQKPWRSLFITSADMDNDNNKDIITGGWWYKNPGIGGGNWIRNTIGQPLNNMAAVYDFDNDGDMDVLGTQGKGSDPNTIFVWGRNDGSGKFTIQDNIEPGDGDFLQGVAVGRFQGGNKLGVALSWHEEGKGIQMLTLPPDPSNDIWSLSRISATSQDEGLSQGDIDRDGDIDLLLGTKWLKNDGGSWEPYTINPSSGSPDRNKLADINGDGRLDAVVGYEAASIPGKLAWYEQGDKATSIWQENIIANIIGPMSLDVTDIDNDGDQDIIVGEHSIINPSGAELLIFENSDGKGKIWNKQVIYTGDEHHDGAQTVDIDNDGDLDVISIGWTHGNVILYENKATKNTQTAPVITTQPVDQKVNAGTNATFSVVATGAPPLSYQWQKNGVAIPGATNAMFTTSAAIISDNGSKYSVIVTNPAGSVLSNTATLTVFSPLNDNINNIIANPGFEEGTTSWNFYTSGTGSFSVIQPGYEGNNSAQVALASENSNIQLYQKGITFEPNSRYKLSFSAFSKSGNDMTVRLVQHVSPYDNYGLIFTPDLSESWQTFTMEFTTTGFTDMVDDGRLMFWFAPFATAGDTYYIDDIKLDRING